MLKQAQWRKNLANARVLVVGDSMLDRYWLGDVNRISPEAPVPVVSVNTIEQRLGGAANVALNISRVGGQAQLLSIIGDDDAGSALEAMLGEEKIESCLQTDHGKPTTLKVRMVSRNQQLLRADFESEPSAEALAASYAAFETVLEAADVVLVSDYGKGGTRDIAKMITLAKAKGKAVYIDPKGKDYSAYQGASLMTPNLSEFQQVVGEVYEFEDINTAAQSLMTELDLSACLITLSERGMLLCQRNAEPIHQATRAREVYDVTGAGDTVIAMMALSKAAGFDDEDAMILANHAAGVVVSKMGTATADLDEIIASMERK